MNVLPTKSGIFCHHHLKSSTTPTKKKHPFVNPAFLFSKLKHSESIDKQYMY